MPRRLLTSAAEAPVCRRRFAFGLALLAYGLGYPAIVIADGFVYPYAPTFGVPFPTAILTIGFLMGAEIRSLAASVVPIVWAFIAATAAWLFGVHADLALPAAGGVLALDLVHTMQVDYWPRFWSSGCSHRARPSPRRSNSAVRRRRTAKPTRWRAAR
jgi:hypothetical protein